MLILSQSTGRVAQVVLPEPSVTAVLRFPDFDYQTLQAIITSVQLQYEASHQISSTLGEDVLLLAFANSLQPMTLGGVIFEDVCEQPQGEENDESLGVEKVQTWWEENNLTSRESPLRITLGSSTDIRAYLVRFDAQLADVATRVWQFRMTLLRVPTLKPLGLVQQDNQQLQEVPDGGLMTQVRQDMVPQPLLLHRVRQPLPPFRPVERFEYELGFFETFTNIPPDQNRQLTGNVTAASSAEFSVLNNGDYTLPTPLPGVADGYDSASASMPTPLRS